MLGYFLTLVATALSLLVTDILLPGVDIQSFAAALIAGVAIGLVNAFIKPVLSVLTLPINFLTLGLFSLVVNGICFSLAAAITPGFSVHGPLSFILAPVILSFASTFINKYFAEKNPNFKPEG
ncbi:MAG: phage holin family protein [Leptolyngbyaceae cyanobacterium SU_3_3]|nr:phage holin family protein [Leptolyngbyaceae cyanobacterium SU_3_3]NJR49305.1 phage holin family protein [Leptolyngbyaceae cyanobacterium CSU_1_3]